MRIFIHDLKEKTGFEKAFTDFLQRHVPWLHNLVLRIAEPRIIRVIQFIIYALMTYTGFGLFISSPASYERIVDVFWVYVLATAVTSGALIGALSVLPGIWWLERVGILLLSTGLGIYIVIATMLGQSPLGIAVFVAFLLTFVQRWSEIRGADLAPKLPREG